MREKSEFPLSFFFFFLLGFPLGFEVKCGQVRLSPVNTRKRHPSAFSLQNLLLHSLDIYIKIHSNFVRRLNYVAFRGSAKAKPNEKNYPIYPPYIYTHTHTHISSVYLPSTNQQPTQQ